MSRDIGKGPNPDAPPHGPARKNRTRLPSEQRSVTPSPQRIFDEP